MDIPISQEQADRIEIGEEPIYRICPELTPCEREFLINGTTPQDSERLDGGCYMKCKVCKYNLTRLEEP